MSEIDYKGYISIHRKITENWLWLSEPFTKSQAWIDLLLMANHKENTFFLRGIKIEVKRGCLARGENNLSFRWKWSKGKVRNFIKLLESEQQIKLHRSNKINIIEILNYDSYQKVNDKVNDKKTAERLQIDQQNDPNNNVNNVNNKNNENNIYQELAEGLKFVLENKLNKKISLGRGWSDEIRKLIVIDLKDRKDAVKDVKNAINAISDNYGKEFFAVIESAKSLRAKFSKIENYLARQENKNKGFNPQEIMDLDLEN